MRAGEMVSGAIPVRIHLTLQAAHRKAESPRSGRAESVSLRLQRAERRVSAVPKAAEGSVPQALSEGLLA